MMRTLEVMSALALMCLVTPSNAHIKKSVTNLVEELWKRVADGRVIITSPNLDSFLARYDPEGRAGLDLIECNFKTGARSWVRDFSTVGVTTEYAAAYFKALDVKGTGMYSRLTIEDVDQLVEICEKHVQRCFGECRGLLSKDEFEAGFKEVIFRTLPITLLYVRFTRHDIDGSFDCDTTLKRPTSHFYYSSIRAKGLAPRTRVAQMSQDSDVRPIFNDEFQYEQMTRRNWDALFLKLSQKGRGRITAEHVGTFWTEGNYGTREEGLRFFNGLAQGAPSLTYVDWEEIFYELDCRNGNKKLDIAEFLQVDLILNGLKRRGDGTCKLKRQ